MVKSLIEFESAQPFATQFLTQALANHHWVNAYIFQSQDLSTAYRMGLRLAQILNCTAPPNPTSACGVCQHCRWIEENAHPGIFTVSNLTYLAQVDAETGRSKTKTGKPQQTIAVAQLENLLKELSLHSGGFHRVVFLTGAHEQHETTRIPPPKDWQPQEEGHFELMPLNRKLFPDPVANKFLKTLEEPPLDTLFILLTDSHEKLLETIVSRCQVVPLRTPETHLQRALPRATRETYEQLLDKVFVSSKGDFTEPFHYFSSILKDTPIETQDALLDLEAFLLEKMKAPQLLGATYSTFNKALLAIEAARVKLQDKTREDAVLECLFMDLTHA